MVEAGEQTPDLVACRLGLVAFCCLSACPLSVFSSPLRGTILLSRSPLLASYDLAHSLSGSVPSPSMSVFADSAGRLEYWSDVQAFDGSLSSVISRPLSDTRSSCHTVFVPPLPTPVYQSQLRAGMLFSVHGLLRSTEAVLLGLRSNECTIVCYSGCELKLDDTLA